METTRREQRAEIARAMAAYTVPRDAAQVMRAAWEIRRRAAARFDCSLTDVHWSLCLRLAWRRGSVTVLAPRKARGAPKQLTARARMGVGHKQHESVRSTEARSGYVCKNAARLGDERDRPAPVPCDWIPRRLLKAI